MGEVDPEERLQQAGQGRQAQALHPQRSSRRSSKGRDVLSSRPLVKFLSREIKFN